MAPIPRRGARWPREVRKIFRSVPFIVDDDDSFGIEAPRLRVSIDQDNLEFHKVEERDVYDTIQAYMAACRSATRTAAAGGIRSRSPCSCRSRKLAGLGTHAVDAGAGQCAARRAHASSSSAMS